VLEQTSPKNGRRKERMVNVCKKNLTLLRLIEIRRSLTSKPSLRKKGRLSTTVSVMLRNEPKKLRINRQLLC
jgi:hypothetical protein